MSSSKVFISTLIQMMLFITGGGDCVNVKHEASRSCQKESPANDTVWRFTTLMHLQFYDMISNSIKNHVEYLMLLSHVGIINDSEDKAVRFYHGLLGFEKIREFVVSTKLSEQLFSVVQEIKVLVFERDGIKLEVFIYPECRHPFPDFNHIGLLLDDFHAIKEKAQQTGVELIVGRTEEKTVYFLKDFSGNLIEIKQK